jgi:hypothetical protein
MIEFSPVLLEHAGWLAENLREEDRQEVARSHAVAPVQLIEHCVHSSSECFTIFDGPHLLGMTGVCPYSVLSSAASPWLLSTEYAAQHPRTLVKFTKPMIEHWLQTYTYLFNFIDAEYTAALRWAKWAGFTIDSPKPYGRTGALFCKVEKRK